MFLTAGPPIDSATGARKARPGSRATCAMVTALPMRDGVADRDPVEAKAVSEHEFPDRDVAGAQGTDQECPAAQKMRAIVAGEHPGRLADRIRAHEVERHGFLPSGWRVFRSPA